jgi:hypothetical protein
MKMQCSFLNQVLIIDANIEFWQMIVDPKI